MVPKLRFPEFRDAGEWEEKKLGDLSKILRGGSPRPIDDYITLEAGGLNWLKIADVNKDAKYVTCTKERVRVTALGKTREVNPGDLIMSNSMSFGRPYILKIKTCIHDGWIAITEIDERANRDYLYYLILSPESQAYFLNNAAGSGVQNLNADIIKLLPVFIPKEPKEQQKIADCLSSLDELIAAHTKKLEALQSWKKGLMQNLFPAEGKTVPKLRFPEFEDSGEWVEKKFSEIADFASGGTPSKNQAKYWGGGIPWISAASMHDIFIEKSDRYITKLAVDDGARLARKGTLLLLVRGSMLHKRIPVGIAGCDVAFNQDVKALKLKKTISERFLLYLIIANEFRLLDVVTKTGIGAGKLDTSDLKDFRVSIPNKPDEQQKIADCLSSLDELIIAQAQKIEDLKAHKKGLMQQIFPAVDDDCMDAGGRATQDAEAVVGA